MFRVIQKVCGSFKEFQRLTEVCRGSRRVILVYSEFQRVSVRFKRFTEVYRGLQRVSESFREVQEVCGGLQRFIKDFQTV